MWAIVRGVSMRRLDTIDIRLLRVFMALVEGGGFPAAQVALNLSQPTISTHLTALERNMGGPLCARGRAGFRLTPLGEATLSAARQLFADIDAFRLRITEFNEQLVGRLRIGIVDGVVSEPSLGLQATIGRFARRAPGVFLDLELGTPGDLEMAVAAGRRDVVVGPFTQKVPETTYQPLHREPHGLYCGRLHELFATDPAAITQQAIERANVSARGYRHLEDLYRIDHPRARATVMHMEAQIMMILSGQFIGFLPRHIGESWAERGEMRILLPHRFNFDSLHLVAFRTADARNGLVAAFVEELRRGRPGGPEAAPAG